MRLKCPMSFVSLCLLGTAVANAQNKPLAPDRIPTGVFEISKTKEPKYFIEIDKETLTLLRDKKKLFESRPEMAGEYPSAAWVVESRKGAVASLPELADNSLAKENERLRTQNRLLSEKVSLLEQKIDELTKK